MKRDFSLVFSHPFVGRTCTRQVLKILGVRFLGEGEGDARVAQARGCKVLIVTIILDVTFIWYTSWFVCMHQTGLQRRNNPRY